jgi:carbamoyltransferase
MIILGLNHGEINSSAALFKDGKIIAAAPEERFTRQKRTKDFPGNSVKYCLKSTGIVLSDVDFVAQAWNPGAYWKKYNPLISGTRIRREDNLYTIPDHLLNLTERRTGDWVMMDFPKETGLPPIYHVRHHLTHAANALFLSPFEEASICTMDWRGEFEATTLGVGHGNSIDVMQAAEIPHSLGLFYATYTQLLGYQPDNDEWKVMALAAYDIDCNALIAKIRGTVRLLENGLFELDESFYLGAHVDQPRLYSEKLVELLGGRVGVRGAEPDEWYVAVAKAMQHVSEEIATHVLKHLHAKTGCKNVVLGGGFFMNSVFNGQILDRTPFENVYVSYAPGDLGNSMGAALYVAHCLKNQKRDFTFNPSYLGPEFTDAEIEAALRRRKIRYETHENIEAQVAQLLAGGQIVAVLNGKMEFGERALGNRSILADPRATDMKNRINAMIKYREGYRPFAPACLRERASLFFDVSEDYSCPYMEKVVMVREKYRSLLPAITHIDGSGRLQTVDATTNRRFHNIITEFEKLTGFPVLLNTSFNINGEPIVLTPDDALSTFFNSGLEFLSMGSLLIRKT